MLICKSFWITKKKKSYEVTMTIHWKKRTKGHTNIPQSLLVFTMKQASPSVNEGGRKLWYCLSDEHAMNKADGLCGMRENMGHEAYRGERNDRSSSSQGNDAKNCVWIAYRRWCSGGRDGFLTSKVVTKLTHFKEFVWSVFNTSLESYWKQKTLSGHL